MLVDHIAKRGVNATEKGNRSRDEITGAIFESRVDVIS